MIQHSFHGSFGVLLEEVYICDVTRREYQFDAALGGILIHKPWELTRISRKRVRKWFHWKGGFARVEGERVELCHVESLTGTNNHKAYVAIYHVPSHSANFACNSKTSCKYRGCAWRKLRDRSESYKMLLPFYVGMQNNRDFTLSMLMFLWLQFAIDSLVYIYIYYIYISLSLMCMST